MNRDLPPLSPQLEALLRDAPRPVPPPGLSDALRRRIDATLEVPPSDPGGGSGGEPPAPPSVAAGSAGVTGLAAKVGTWGVALSVATFVAGTALGVGVGASVFSAPAEVTEARVAPAVEERSAASVPLAPLPPPEEPVAAVAPPAKRVPTPSRPSPRPVSPPVTVPASPPAAKRDLALSEERALLERARTALGRSQPEVAQAAAEEHLRRFPDGQLAEEREVLWVQALMRLERHREAQQKAHAFRRKYPQSILLPVLEAAMNEAGGSSD